MMFFKRIIFLFAFLILTYQVNVANAQGMHRRGPPCNNQIESFIGIPNYDFYYRLMREADDFRDFEKKQFQEIREEISKSRNMLYNINKSIKRCENLKTTTSVPFIQYTTYPPPGK